MKVYPSLLGACCALLSLLPQVSFAATYSCEVNQFAYDTKCYWDWIDYQLGDTCDGGGAGRRNAQVTVEANSAEAACDAARAAVRSSQEGRHSGQCFKSGILSGGRMYNVDRCYTTLSFDDKHGCYCTESNRTALNDRGALDETLVQGRAFATAVQDVLDSIDDPEVLQKLGEALGIL